MSDELQALCFLAGANSIFYGEKLLTTGNPDVTHDRQLFARLGLTAAAAPARVPGVPRTPRPRRCKKPPPVRRTWASAASPPSAPHWRRSMRRSCGAGG